MHWLVLFIIILVPLTTHSWNFEKVLDEGWFSNPNSVLNRNFFIENSNKEASDIDFIHNRFKENAKNDQRNDLNGGNTIVDCAIMHNIS